MNLNEFKQKIRDSEWVYLNDDLLIHKEDYSFIDDFAGFTVNPYTSQVGVFTNNTFMGVGFSGAVYFFTIEQDGSVYVDKYRSYTELIEANIFKKHVQNFFCLCDKKIMSSAAKEFGYQVVCPIHNILFQLVEG